MPRPSIPATWTLAVVIVLSSISALACGVLPYTAAPAAGYSYGSGAPLRVAMIDETGGDDWSPAIRAAASSYEAATTHLDLEAAPGEANIVVTLHRYEDSAPPELRGYRFEPGVGGFAAVYDADGNACNFPPSALPLNCSGEIARTDIYLNDIIPAGSDIDARRERLVLHELGHALGLTRHSPDLGIGQLGQRYGWPPD
ncbi:MAG TPA: hypothetical protein VIH21_07170 [Dehalococcoidia bacterium]